jgi:hypothetical protein
MTVIRFLGVVAAAALPVVALGHDTPQAHASCTSQFTYNENIFPILRDRCGSCHVTGGAAPMTLLTFRDATQWASAMRDELTTERMPPWQVDPASPPVKGANPIQSSEINKVIDWGACNTPHGDLTKTLPVVTYKPEWKLGPPDAKLQMPAHTAGPDKEEEVVDVPLATSFGDTKWLKAVDLMPTATSMARDAVISVDKGPVLALWEPGNNPVTAPAGTAFKLAAGATIHLQIHYKKNYLNESATISDQSTVGLYFTDPPAAGHELEALAIDPPSGADAGTGTRTFTHALPSAARIVALRPMLDQPYAQVAVNALGANGQRTPLLDLQGAWPQWFRRYWLQQPIDLPAGTTVEVRVTPRQPDPSEPTPPKRFPLEVGLDYVQP